MIHSTEKKERSLGEHLHLKGARCQSPKCAFARRPYRPGVHGKKKGKKNTSDFGRQMREKQKFKVSYGLNDQNLRQIFLKAQKRKGSTAERLVELLESRLDNVVYRLGFAPSRSMARQLISHGHIFMNQKRVKSPGITVRVHDRISIRPESAGKAHFRDLRESLAARERPSWLAVDIQKLEGTVLAPPLDANLPFEVNILVESFSK